MMEFVILRVFRDVSTVEEDEDVVVVRVVLLLARVLTSNFQPNHTDLEVWKFSIQPVGLQSTPTSGLP